MNPSEAQVMAELGRLHMENIALKALAQEQHEIIRQLSGAAPAELAPDGESESESDPRDPSGPAGDELPGTDG